MRRTIALGFLAALVFVVPAYAARQFNGTDQALESASNVDLSSYTKITVAFWIWWDSFGTNDDLAMEHSNAGDVAGFNVDLNCGFCAGTDVAAGVFDAGVVFHAERFRPTSGLSAATWQHHVVTFDKTQSGGDVTHWYVNGSDAGTPQGGNPTTNFASTKLYVMSRNSSSLFGAGRIAELAIWGGYNFDGTDVSNLYNGGSGTAASNVQSGSLIHYWQVCGSASPEPASVGSVALNLVGSPTNVTHPISGSGICGAGGGGSARMLLLGVGP